MEGGEEAVLPIPEEEPVSFEQRVEVDGAVFAVRADVGVFPADTVLWVEPTKDNAGAFVDALAQDGVEAAHRLYRIEILDGSGNACVPDTTVGAALVSIQGLGLPADSRVAFYDVVTEAVCEISASMEAEDIFTFPFVDSTMYDIVTLTHGTRQTDPTESSYASGTQEEIPRDSAHETIAEEVEETPAEEAVVMPTEEHLDAPAEKLVEVLAEESVEATEEELVEVPAEEFVETTAEKSAEEEPVVESGTEETVEESTEETTVEVSAEQEPVEEPETEEPVKEPAEEKTVEEPAAEESIENLSMEDAVEEPAAEVVELAVEADPVGEATVEASTEKTTAEEAVEAPVAEAAAGETERTTAEPVEEPNERADAEPVAASSEAPADDFAGEADGEVELLDVTGDAEIC